ncbi:GIY-YIG nuclease family protein [Staphylococcus pettenkoferi]|uniref:GIY-YIG nuclease family protein n=1 Tax=Staphylococcus pettenkoferi TaxID=170573 RepID=UPI00066EDFC1|nr:GIY-YIG nuclease family protein [Staphylococcus pettenkoferi]MDK7114646.1 GIY-YIG nuclease family protein [Staphylococcus pettenkoferi]
MTDNLDDIFSDDLFETLITQGKRRKKEDIEATKFKEILTFVKENNREPSRTKGWSEERALWARLQGFRDKKDRADKVKHLDDLNLLDRTSTFLNKIKESEISSIDEVLNDDYMFEEYTDLLDISRYKKTVNAASKKSTRKYAKDFAKYKKLFESVHEDIASGKRKLVPFKKYDIESGRFYVQNGVMLYIVSISNEKFIGENGKKNARMHVVYENGTENKQLLLQSLASSLYSTERNGRMVTNIVDDESISESFGVEFTTGYVYVLKSLSSNPSIKKLDNLYKIGFTRNNIESRISNAENEVTYLNAPVRLVLSIEVKNLNAQVLERALHHEFQDKQVIFNDVTHKKATEWYIVTIEEIQQRINKILTNVQY